MIIVGIMGKFLNLEKMKKKGRLKARIKREMDLVKSRGSNEL